MSSELLNMHSDSTFPTADKVPPPPPQLSSKQKQENVNFKVSRCANAAVLSIKASSRSKFTIAKEKINPQVAPELLHIKENVMTLPHNSLLALSRISELFESLHSEFGTYRCQWDNQDARQKMQSMSVDDKKAKSRDILQIISQLRNTFLTRGNEILDQHQCQITQIENSIKENEKIVEEKLRLIHKLETDNKYQQGLWEALKDKAVPTFMGNMESSSASGDCIQALSALIIWATDFVISGISFHISFKQDQLREVLQICKSTLESQLRLYATTKEELNKHKAALGATRDMLRNLDEQIWKESVQPIELAMESDAEDILKIAITETEKSSLKQTLALAPIRRYQALLGGDTGPGIHMKRDVEMFCDVVPTVLEDLKLLCSAKTIIKYDDQVDFETNIYGLGRVIFRRLEQFKNLYYRSEVADPLAQETFLKRETLDFARDTAVHIHAIDNILRTRVSNRKGKRLSKLRDDGDRYHGNFNWESRPVTTGTEGLGILQRVEMAIEFIHNVSISSCTGLFLRSAGSRETQSGGSFVDFNLANASLSDFWSVIRRVVEPGVEFFNSATIEKPKSRFAFPKF